MKYSKPVSTPFVGHIKLSKKSCPSIEKEKDKMSVISYSLRIGNLMYVMVHTRPDISHALRVMSGFLANPNKTH